jgi:polyisoprenyl-phosphate glycosyltransferase
MMASMVELSVVSAVYGCRECLIGLYERLCAAASEVTNDFELIFVDDRSPDGAWSVLSELARRDSRVRAYRLSRNFGETAAITAGLSRSRGRWTVVIDCDLQEPPEAIPALYRKALDGYDVVSGARLARRDTVARRVLGSVYRSLTLGSATDADIGTLSILSRKVVGAFLELRDVEREFVIALTWLGFDRASVPFEHAERASGKSAYNFQRLFRVALSGMFFRTTVLLRWIVLLGFLIALVGVGLVVWVVYTYFTSTQPRGYASLAVLLIVLVGFVIITLGVLGLYIGRIFEQVKGRPLFVIDEQAHAPSEDEAPVFERTRS